MNLLLEGANIWDIYEKYYKDKLDKETFNILAHIDPTCKNDQKGKYLPWIIRQYLEGMSHTHQWMIEDPEMWIYDIQNEWHKELEWFEKHKQLPQITDKNIDHYTPSDLGKLIDEFGDIQNNQELQNNFDVIYQDDTWKLYEPHTYEAERYIVWHILGGAQWCTAAGENGDRYNGREMFERYIENGNNKLHIFQNIKTNEIYQYSQNDEEFRDRENNDELDVDEIGFTDALVAWYNRKYNIMLYNVIQEKWDDYAIFNEGYGEVVGYFKDGELYDIDKEYLGDYNSIGEIFSSRMLMHRNDGNVDLYDCRGDLSLDCRAITHYDIEDSDENILYGVDESGDFDVYSLDYTWNWYTSGIADYEEWNNDILLLQWSNDSNTYDLVSLYTNDFMIYSGAYIDDEHQPYIDDNDDEILYFYAMRQGEIKLYKINYREGEGHEEEVTDELDYEDEEDEEEMVQAEQFVRSFKSMTNKLNEIHKRNIPLLFE